MTGLILRLAGALTLLALAACAQTARTPQAAAPGAILASMTDPGTGGVVIPGPSLRGTAPRTPGKTLGTAAIDAPAAQSGMDPAWTTGADIAPARPPPEGGPRHLGSTVAALGDPSLPGFWVRTPLVQADGDGRVVNPANGRAASVRLIAAGGPADSGSQVSLPALQALGVSLTDLPALSVYQD